MSEFKASSFTNEDGSHGPDFVGLTTFTSPYYFVPPSGTTAERPSGSDCVPGLLRFNTDIGRLEVWRGDHWGIILGESPNLGISTAAAPASGGTGARGVFGGGYTLTPTNRIDYITISTLGNSLYFGDLTTARSGNASCSSSTRGLFAGGNTPPGAFTDAIYYLSFSSTGNTSSFGTLVSGITRYVQGCSNATRGLFGGGQGPGYSYRNNIDYVTIASEGTSVNFGQLLTRCNLGATCASSTRGVWAGGYNDNTSLICHVTISTLGNANNFGNLTVGRYTVSGCSNSVRGVFAGGFTPSPTPNTVLNTIDYITIASKGDATNFGQLSVTRLGTGSCSSSTRGVFAGGYTAPSPAILTNVIDYVTISATGNAVNFGNLSGSHSYFAGCSNGHGGL